MQASKQAPDSRSFVRSEIADSARSMLTHHAFICAEGRKGGKRRRGGVGTCQRGASEGAANEGAVCVVIVLPSDAAAAPPSTKISERDTGSESEPEHFQHAKEHRAFNLTMKTPCSAQNAPSLSGGLGSNEGSLGKRRWLCFTIFSRRNLARG